MALRYITKPVHKLTESEYAQCASLTHDGQGSYGLMYGELQRQRKEKKGKAYMCFENRRLVGWVLGFHVDNYGPKYHVYTYVLKSHRKKGIAKKLIARARMGRTGPVGVYLSNAANSKLYQPLIDNGRAVGM